MAASSAANWRRVGPAPAHQHVRGIVQRAAARTWADHAGGRRWPPASGGRLCGCVAPSSGAARRSPPTAAELVPSRRHAWGSRALAARRRGMGVDAWRALTARCAGAGDGERAGTAAVRAAQPASTTSVATRGPHTHARVLHALGARERRCWRGSCATHGLATVLADVLEADSWSRSHVVGPAGQRGWRTRRGRRAGRARAVGASRRRLNRRHVADVRRLARRAGRRARRRARGSRCAASAKNARPPPRRATDLRRRPVHVHVPGRRGSHPSLSLRRREMMSMTKFGPCGTAPPGRGISS